ncbi:MAG: toll/interleukin-1 receptor domain-containing protein [Aurantimonas endophytica]|uniref:toll/interleukin-1 receptor domain-containing protein n=1 Tax=Aurantimonas endophytica TaxID=1522175 RepID=UPI0030021DB3
MAAAGLLGRYLASRITGGGLKIFLGYASERLEAALEVFDFLDEGNDAVWFDKKALVPGDDWDAERLRAQREADLVIHLYSGEIADRAGVVNREIRESLRLVEDQPIESLFLVVIRLDPVHVPVQLLRFQYVDHFENGWREKLTRSLEKRREQLAGRNPTASREIPKADEARQITEEIRMTDAQKIEFEDITDTYECRGDYLRYDGEGLYWDYVNGAIAFHVLSNFFMVRQDFRAFFDDEAGLGDVPMKSEWSTKTEEFFRSGERVSLRFYAYIGYARAAHPNHLVTTLNFFGSEGGPLNIQSLLGHSGSSARKILDYCEKVLMAGFDGDFGDQSFFDRYKSSDEDIWELLSHFNYDRRGMTFNFSSASGLPFVMGVHDAFVPWSVLSGMVSSEDEKLIERISAAA